MISLELAYGYSDHDIKDVVDNVGDDEDDYQQFDIVLPINIAKGFTIYPTIAIYDENDSTAGNAVGTPVTLDEGRSIVYGITWALFF